MERAFPLTGLISGAFHKVEMEIILNLVYEARRILLKRTKKYLMIMEIPMGKTRY
jgi:hypothetical protein